jgi:hypothetical protein
MTKHVASTTKKFLAAGGLAFGLASLGLFGSVGTAAADGLDATPMPPAVIDDNGTHETPDTGSYDELLNTAQEGCWTGSGAPSSSGCSHSRLTGSYPADPSWPGGNAKP